MAKSRTQGMTPAGAHVEQGQRTERAVPYVVYIVQCGDGTLYTGTTTDVVRRVRQHNGELTGGAAYTRSHRPVVLVYTEHMPSRAIAQQREARIKRLSHEEKVLLIKNGQLTGRAQRF